MSPISLSRSVAGDQRALLAAGHLADRAGDPRRAGARCGEPPAPRRTCRSARPRCRARCSATSLRRASGQNRADEHTATPLADLAQQLRDASGSGAPSAPKHLAGRCRRSGRSRIDIAGDRLRHSRRRPLRSCGSAMVIDRMLCAACLGGRRSCAPAAPRRSCSGSATVPMRHARHRCVAATAASNVVAQRRQPRRHFGAAVDQRGNALDAAAVGRTGAG